jgi:hypothetical protein
VLLRRSDIGTARNHPGFQPRFGHDEILYLSEHILQVLSLSSCLAHERPISHGRRQQI